MAGKFYGAIGFALQVETAPDVYREQITERMYIGDVVRNSYKPKDGDQINQGLTLEHKFSIMADKFCSENLGRMRYVEWNKQKWQIKSIEEARPRVILNIGGIYNEQQATGVQPDPPGYNGY